MTKTDVAPAANGHPKFKRVQVQCELTVKVLFDFEVEEGENVDLAAMEMIGELDTGFVSDEAASRDAVLDTVIKTPTRDFIIVENGRPRFCMYETKRKVSP